MIAQSYDIRDMVNLLFYNPWGTSRFISGMTDLSIDQTRRALSNQAIFQRETIPFASCFGSGNRGTTKRPYQTVYALTGISQKQILNKHRAPKFLASTILLHYSRLDMARKIALEYKKKNKLNWVTSPWRPGPGAPFYDSLMSVRVRGDSDLSYLVAIVSSQSTFGYNWYREIVMDWEDWRKTPASENIPAVLLLWRPSIGHQEIAALSHLASNKNGGIALVYDPAAPGAKGDWKPLIKNRRSGVIAAWKMPTSTSASLLPQYAYAEGVRQRPYRNATTFRLWTVKSKSKLAGVSAYFINDCSETSIEILDMITRYPGLSRKGYKLLNQRGNINKFFDAKLNELIEHGFIKENEEVPETYLPTADGIEMFGAIHGVNSRYVIKNYGWLQKTKKFDREHSHLETIQKFMLRFAEEGLLLNWSYVDAKYYFTVIRMSYSNKPRKIFIYPDSAARIKLSGGRCVSFWLEVDRGTRQGGAVDRQLEKYFLAHYTLDCIPIPPIIFLFDTRDENNEGRLKMMGRKLETLYKKYPGSRLKVIMTTIELFDNSRAKPTLDSRIWRVSNSGEMSTVLISLDNALCEQSIKSAVSPVMEI